MPLKAVFFDLDDTLVATSEIDRRVYAVVGELALRLAPGIVVGDLLADFKRYLQRAPHGPEHVVNITKWRAALWTRALQKQSNSGATLLGTTLQVM